MIIQAGIKRIVFNKDYDSELSKEMLFESEDIEIVHHPMWVFTDEVITITNKTSP